MHAYLRRGIGLKICNGIPLALHMPSLTNQHTHTHGFLHGLEMIQQQPKQEDDLPSSS